MQNNKHLANIDKNYQTMNCSENSNTNNQFLGNNEQTPNSNYQLLGNNQQTPNTNNQLLGNNVQTVGLSQTRQIFGQNRQTRQKFGQKTHFW